MPFQLVATANPTAGTERREGWEGATGTWGTSGGAGGAAGVQVIPEDELRGNLGGAG